MSRVLRALKKGRSIAPGCPQTRRGTPGEGFPTAPDSLARAGANPDLPTALEIADYNCGYCGGFCGDSVSKVAVIRGNVPLSTVLLTD